MSLVILKCSFICNEEVLCSTDLLNTPMRSCDIHFFTHLSKYYVIRHKFETSTFILHLKSFNTSDIPLGLIANTKQ